MEKTPRAASLLAGGGPDLVRDLISGKAKNPRADTLIALARVLACDVAYLTGEQDVPLSKAPNRGSVVMARIAGPVQAGHFVQVNLDQTEPSSRGFVPTVRDPDFPSLELLAFEVLGDSINRRCEPGGYAIAVDFVEAGVRLRQGMCVVAERRRGDLLELTIKIIRLVNGKHELHPDSTNPEWKPIQFPSAEAHEEVRIVGLVRRFVGPILPA